MGLKPFELLRGWEYGGAPQVREELALHGRRVVASVTPVLDEAGALQGLCAVLHDVTEQRALEARKEEFVSIVGHELRTPLTALGGALDLLLGVVPGLGALNERQARYAQLAQESVHRLTTIVDDLLDLSRFASGKLRMEETLVDLGALVARALERYAPALAEAGLSLEQALAQEARLLGDPGRLTQVLDNLLTNAVKFTPRGGRVRVCLRTPEALPGLVLLTCWNSGEPIAEEDLERIFDKFEQARTVRTRTVRGTGLGLSVCRDIVQAHGGRVWSEPVPDGALFVVALWAERHPPSGRERALPERTLLVVEGPGQLALGLKATLTAAGHRVVVAPGPEAAAERARQLLPGAVLYSGLPPALPPLSVPSVVVGPAEDRPVARGHGARFLATPIRPDRLLAVVEGACRGGRWQGQVLVVDPDPAVGALCREVLGQQGFAVECAGGAAEAQRLLVRGQPELLLLAQTLPDGSAEGLLEAVKAERAALRLPVLRLCSPGEGGPADGLLKPLHALELLARVEETLRRREQEPGLSPTTRLPGSGAIQQEVQRRLERGEPFAVCYLELDNLKAYHDHYGFARAEGVVRQAGELLRELLARAGRPGDFLGHVAGDDFVFVTDAATVDALCLEALEAFSRVLPLSYDRADRERGYLEVSRRRASAEPRRVALMGVSIAAVMVDQTVRDLATVAARATELKRRAKASPGSHYLRSDRDEPMRALPSVG